jgi:HEAT repeat protein
MKMITIVAAMSLAAASASAMAQTQGSTGSMSLERASTSRASRDSRGDLGRSLAGPEMPMLRQGDPADSLYQRGREALNRHNYTQAADLFKTLADRYPKSERAPSAMYFRAFALYQTDNVDRMREARDVLTALGKNYPNTDLSDAKELGTRVCGKLAQRGDADCAAKIFAAAEATDRGDGSSSAASGKQGSLSTKCPDDDDDDERVAALNALMQMDSDRAMPILKKVLARRDACSQVLRRKAVWLISQKGGEEAADILVQTAKTDPDQETREQAVFWLGQTRSDRAVTLLEDILKNSTNDEIKNKAIFALSQHQSARAGQILRDFAERESENEELREQAIFWLGQKHSEDNANYLKSLYGRVKKDALKEKIIFSLSQQRGNGEWVMNIALDPKESIEMRKQALFWAGQNGGVSIDAFSALYDKMTDQEIKEQLIFVFSQKRDAKALDKLFSIAKNDKDKEMRSKAVFWIGQSKDPRAVKFIEDLISK